MPTVPMMVREASDQQLFNRFGGRNAALDFLLSQVVGSNGSMRYHILESLMAAEKVATY